MAVTNPLLYNAALAGFLGGALEGRAISDTVSADYNALVAAAVSFATKFDSFIAADVAATPQPAGSQPITVGTTSIAPTTGLIIEGEIGKSLLAYSVCRSVVSGAYNTSATAGTQLATVAQAASVAYLNAALATNASYA